MFVEAARWLLRAPPRSQPLPVHKLLYREAWICLESEGQPACRLGGLWGTKPDTSAGETVFKKKQQKQLP